MLYFILCVNFAASVFSIFFVDKNTEREGGGCSVTCYYCSRFCEFSKSFVNSDVRALIRDTIDALDVLQDRVTR